MERSRQFARLSLRVHQVAFHPANHDRWIAGGEGCVFLTDDNGQTWSCQNYWGDETRSAYWYFTAFDDEHPDTVYMAGFQGRNGGTAFRFAVSIKEHSASSC